MDKEQTPLRLKFDIQVLERENTYSEKAIWQFSFSGDEIPTTQDPVAYIKGRIREEIDRMNAKRPLAAQMQIDEPL